MSKVEFVVFADGIYSADLLEIDRALSTLSEEDLDTLCTGEESEQQAVLGKLPTHLHEKINGLLQDIFEGDY